MDEKSKKNKKIKPRNHRIIFLVNLGLSLVILGAFLSWKEIVASSPLSLSEMFSDGKKILSEILVDKKVAYVATNQTISKENPLEEIRVDNTNFVLPAPPLEDGNYVLSTGGGGVLKWSLVDSKTISNENGLGDTSKNLISSDSNIFLEAREGLINPAVSLGRKLDISDETNLKEGKGLRLEGDSLRVASSVARDNELHDVMTLSGTADYLVLDGQKITRNLIDLTSHVTGVLPIANGGTGTATGSPIFDNLTLRGNLTTSGTITAGVFEGSFTGGFAPSGDVDMLNHLMINIGNAGTDFSPSGGLTLANTLIVSTGGANISGIITATGGNSSNWNTSYSWGNHATFGYLTASSTNTLTNKTWNGNRVDVSDYTNLSGNTEILLTGDTLSIAASIARDSELHSALNLSGQNYLSLTGQTITASQINLTSNVTGTLPIASGGTGSTTLNDLIALGTHTAGNYISTITGNAQIVVGGAGSENAIVALSIGANSIGDSQLAYNTGQDLTSFSSPTFAGLNLSGMTSGSIFFQGATGLAQDNENFFWDDVNKRLGVGTGSPSGILSIGGSSSDNVYLFKDGIEDVGTGVDGQSLYIYRNQGVTADYIRLYTNSVNENIIYGSANWRLTGGNTITLDAGIGYFRFYENETFGYIQKVNTSMQQLLYGLSNNVGNQLVIGTNLGWNKDFDHELQNHPTVFIHSSTSPETVNTEWGSMAFVGTGSGEGYFNIANGVGDIVLQPQGNVGIGMTSPGAKLDVQGISSWDRSSVDGTPVAKVYNANSGNGQISMLIESASDASGLRFKSASHYWDWFTGAGGEIRFDSDGGTSKLQISNTAKQYSLYANSVGVGIGTASVNSALTVNGGMDINGNVGIGTTSPIDKLTIGDGTGNPALRLYGEQIAGGAKYGSLFVDGYDSLTFAGNVSKVKYNVAQFLNSDVDLNFSNRMTVDYNSASDSMRFTGGAFWPNINILTIDNSGNVGIGTTNPGKSLHIVQADSSSASGLLLDNGIGNTGHFYINAAGSFISTASGNSTYSSEGATNFRSNANINFQDFSGANARMVIDSSGNVGIGTSTPTGKLQVNQSDYLHGIELYGYNDRSNAYMKFSINDWGAARIDATGYISIGGSGLKLSDDGIFTFGSQQDYAFNFDGTKFILRSADIDGTVKMGNIFESALGTQNISFNGNVGVGIASPAYKLDVLGDANVSGILTVGTLSAANLSSASAISAPYFTATSALGTSTFAGGIDISGNIIPISDNTYSLGSETRMWKDVYIGPGSLYVNGKKVIEEASDSMVFGADLNQNLIVRTSGSGDIELNPLDAGVIQLKGNVQLTAGNTFRTSTGVPIDFSDGILADNLSLAGNLLSAGNINGSLELSANGLGAVYVTTGNFGIGTTGPLEKLDVAGRLHLAQTTAPGTTADRLYNVGGGLYWNGLDISSGGSGATQWTTSGMDVYYSSGNVGIGTTSPEARLSVEGAGTGAGFNVGFSIDTDSNDYGPIISGYSNNGLGYNLIYFNGAFSARNDQNIVYGSSSNFYTRYNSSMARFELADSNANNLLTVKDQGTAADFNFNNGQFFINNGGNVGIGTTSPTTSLQISSGTLHGISVGLDYPSWMGDNGLYIAGTAYAKNGYIVGDGNAIRWEDSKTKIMGYAKNDIYRLLFHTNGLERMRIDTSGNVGIGTTSPTAQLAIAGATGANQSLSVSKADTTTSGYNYGSSFMITSNPASDSTATIYALSTSATGQGSAHLNSIGTFLNQTYNDNTNLTNTATALNNQVFNRSTGTLTWATGESGAVSNTGAGTITTGVGLSANVSASAGTITNARSVLVNMPSISGTGSIGLAYGMYLYGPTNTGTGTIGNKYGLFVGDVSGATSANYAMYTNTGKVHFGDQVDIAGNVGIGTTSPNNALTVLSTNGAVTASFQSDGYANQRAYFINGTTASIYNTAGFSYFLKTATSVQSAYDMVASFTDINDATRTSRIDFKTANEGVMDTRLSILGSNVGIGTTNPDKKLTIGDGTNNPTFKMYGKTSSGEISYLTLILPASPTADPTFTAGGASNNIIWNNNLKISDNKYLNLGSSNNYFFGYNSVLGKLILSDGYGYNNFLTVNDAGSTADFNFNDGQIYIHNEGNVGIGTITPEEILTIGDGTGAPKLRINGIGDGTGAYANQYIDQWDRLVFDGTYYYAKIANGIGMNVNNMVLFSGQSSSGIGYSTAGNDSVYIGVDSTQNSMSRTLIVGNKADFGYDFGHPVQDNPTLFVHSSNRAADEWIGLSHNQTNAEINWGKGSLLLNGGSVGIGTTNPTVGNILHTVGGNIRVDKAGAGTAIIVNRTDGKSSALQAAFGGSTFLYDNTGYFGIYATTSGNVLAGSAAGGTDVLRIDGSGNVGIGTTSPTAKLDVVSSDYDTKPFRIANTAGPAVMVFHSPNGYSSKFQFGDEDSAAITAYNGNGVVADRFMQFNINDTPKIRIQANGNVGIGTTTPSQQLDITKSMALTNTTNANQFGIIYKGGLPFIHDFNYGDNGTVTTVGQNLFIGENAGNLTMGSTATQNFEGSYNTAIGFGALHLNTTGNSNFALGRQSLQANTTGSSNSALGRNSLYSNISGSSNLAIGHSSMFANTTGNGNSAFGNHSLTSNISGEYNTSLGYAAGYANITGGRNIFIGINAGRYIADGVTANITGDYNVFIGENTKALADNDQNETVIGYGATGVGSNSVVLGNDSVLTTALKGNVGIGTTTPQDTLVVSKTVGENTGETRFGGSNGRTLLAYNNGELSHFDFYAVGVYFGSNLTLGRAKTFDFYNYSGDYDVDYAKIYVSSEESFNFKVNNQDRLSITSAGNVGIGTTSPSEKLQIIGNLDIVSGARTLLLGGDLSETTRTDNTSKYSRIAGAHYSNSEEPMAYMLTMSSSGTNALYIGGGSVALNAATLVSFYTAANNTTVSGTERMRINNLGNVGIGTISPQGNLHISQTADSQDNARLSEYGLVITNPDNLTDTEVGIGFRISTDIASNPGGAITFERTGGSSVGSLHFKTSNLQDFTATRMTINADGNVGIGTTSPQGILDVKGGTADAGIGGKGIFLSGQNGGTGDTDGGTIFLNPGTKSGTGTVAGIVAIGFTPAELAAHTWLNTNALYSKGYAYMQGGYLSGNSMGMSWGTSSAYVRGSGSSNSTDNIRYATNSVERLRIDGNGNVGIGTESPGYKLDINGGINVSSGSAYKYNGVNVIVADTANTNYFFAGAGTLSMTGYSNLGVGAASLYGNTSGIGNAAFGHQSGRSNTTGSNNLFIGTNAGYADGTVSTLGNLTNATAIGYNAQVTASNSIVLGGIGAYGVNVGIGTTSPDKLLTLQQLNDDNGIKIYGYDDRSANSVSMSVDSWGGGMIQSVGLKLNGTGNLIEAWGPFNVGANWDGAGDNYALKQYGYIAAAGAAKYIQWQVNDVTDNFELTRQDSNVGHFDIKMPTIFTGGNVGIGTTTPDRAKLVVEGSVTYDNGVYGYLDSSGTVNTSSGAVDTSIYASSRIVASEFDAVSDKRVKVDINHIQNALDLVENLDVVAYNKLTKDSSAAMGEMGLIAQDLADVFPLAVRISQGQVPGINGEWKDVNDFHSVNYQTVTMLGIQAIQELASSVKDQQGLLLANVNKVTTLDLRTQNIISVEKGKTIFEGMVVADVLKANRIEGLEFITKDIADADMNLAKTAEELAILALQVENLNSDISELTSSFSVKNLNVMSLASIKELEVSGAVTFKGEAEFQGPVVFRKIAEFIDKTVFRNDVEFAGKVENKGTVTFNSDTAGYAVIQAGKNKVDITFKNEYTTIPIITATLRSGVKLDWYRVTDESTKGFTIEIDPKKEKNIKFAWTAVMVSDAGTTESEEAEIDESEVDNSVSEENIPEATPDVVSEIDENSEVSQPSESESTPSEEREVVEQEIVPVDIETETETEAETATKTD